MKVFSCKSSIYGNPVKVFSEESSIYGNLVKVFSEASSIYGNPVKVFSGKSSILNCLLKVFWEAFRNVETLRKFFQIKVQYGTFIRKFCGRLSGMWQPRESFLRRKFNMELSSESFAGEFPECGNLVKVF